MSTGGEDWPFELDRFQREAIAAIDAGRSVLVAAPTGSGKTVIAEHAVNLALAAGRRIFYTTPIKALSNQKFADLVRLHGADAVGLLTGDNSINGDAAVVVMTTEVLRNMVYSGAELTSLAWVVLDEVHYLQDAYRGPVWEEVIIHVPSWVRLVALSATVSNADELADWISDVRGPTDVVVELERPIRLEHLFLAADRTSDRLHLIPTLIDGRPNPEGPRFDAVAPQRGQRHGRGDRPRKKFSTPRRLEVVDELADRDLLPAIIFIFSRAGCDEAVMTLRNAGVRLTSEDERQRIRSIVAGHVRNVAEADLDVLGYQRWLAGLEAGIGAHHAGMVPPFKEAVEACFNEGLIKVVFATETLALGVNMPARTVVIERMTKYNGERHDTLTAGEYTQLTGRAGRRGIDPIGHAVTLWSPFTSFEETAALAASRSFVLRSAFRPTYNMAANMVRRYERDAANGLLNSSFAQYQADRTIVRHQQRIVEREALVKRMFVELELPADQVAEYGELRRLARMDGREEVSSQQALEDAISKLPPGAVIRVDRAAQAAVVLAVGQRRNGASRVRAMTVGGKVVLLHPNDFDAAPVRLGSIELPRPFAPNNRSFLNEVRRRLRDEVREAPGTAGVNTRGGNSKGGHSRGGLGRDGLIADRRGSVSRLEPQDELVDLGLGSQRGAAWAALHSHPLHGHRALDRCLRQLRRIRRMEREIQELRDRVDAAEDTVARRFERLLLLLEDRGCVQGWTLTERGELLARCYHECDLLVVEALSEGLFDGLDAATFVALLSVFTYEHRSRNLPQQSWLPTADARSRYERIVELSRDLRNAEEEAHTVLTREPDATFAGLAFAWASGGDLDDVLADEELSGGDFVRNVKQLLDLCRQLGDLAPNPRTAATARRGADLLFRGVVSAASMLDEPETVGTHQPDRSPQDQ